MAIEKILWGDDDEGILKSVAYALKPEYNIEKALTPEEVIEKAEKKQYKIVITDLNYTSGGQEGFSIIKAIKDNAKYVILCTGDADKKEVQQEAKEVGAYGILKKPFSIPDLKDYLKNLK